jgi:hypothetical protein
MVLKSSSISWLLGQAQHAVQGIISNITQEVIHAGISTDQGLASLNQDGIFLSETPVVDRERLQKEYERMLKLKTLLKIWREQVSPHFQFAQSSSVPLGSPHLAFSNYWVILRMCSSSEEL